MTVPIVYEFEDTPKAFQRLMQRIDSGKNKSNGNKNKDTYVDDKMERKHSQPQSQTFDASGVLPVKISKKKKKTHQLAPPPEAAVPSKPRFRDVVTEPPNLTVRPKQVFKKMAPLKAARGDDYDTLALDTDLYELGIDYESLVK